MSDVKVKVNRLEALNLVAKLKHQSYSNIPTALKDAELLRRYIEKGPDLNPRDSNTVAHAIRELEILGETDPWTVEGYLDMVKLFAGMGHSGESATQFIFVLNELLCQRPLTNLTDNPEEWTYRDKSMWPPNGIWQSVRDGRAFSFDKGKTYTLTVEGPVGGETTPLHYSENFEVSEIGDDPVAG